MRKQTIAASAVAVSLVLTPGIGGAAYAYQDSGVHSYGCGSQYGKLSVYQQGSGNSWAPGDWSAYSQWNGNTTNYRWVYDYENPGSGGGYWRVATNATYPTATPSCSPLAVAHQDIHGLNTLFLLIGNGYQATDSE